MIKANQKKVPMAPAPPSIAPPTLKAKATQAGEKSRKLKKSPHDVVPTSSKRKKSQNLSPNLTPDPFDTKERRILEEFALRSDAQTKRVKADNPAEPALQKTAINAIIAELARSSNIVDTLKRVADRHPTFFPITDDSPKSEGFTLVNEWDGLFRLYQKGEEFRTVPSPQLSQITSTLVRGHSSNDLAVVKVEDALLLLAIARIVAPEIAHETDLGIEKDAFMFLFDSIAPFVFGAYFSESETKASRESDKAVALFAKAMSGIVKMNFPARARRTGGLLPRPVIAITIANSLCEKLRRLPTKSEVREDMELIGWSYASKGKDIKGKWSDLFVCAGLSGLPD
jgi:hypothetical protein